MLNPVERASLSNQVYEQLRDHILSEGYRAGERLPPERELCEMLQVNRSSVREALKRLEQSRLIDIRHGDGSVVLDFKLHAGFELMGNLVMPGGRFNPAALRSILEFRTLIGPEIARLAARRIQAPQLEHIKQVVAQIGECADSDVKRFQDLDFEFHYAMAVAGENLALLLILNTIKDIYFKFRDQFVAMFSHTSDSGGVYRQIYEALSKHDEEGARCLCAQLIENGNQMFWAMYEHTNSQGLENESQGEREG